MRNLLEKLLNNTISEKEFDRLMEYINKPENEHSLKEMIQDYLVKSESLKSPNINRDSMSSEKLYQTILKNIEEKENFSSSTKSTFFPKRYQLRHAYRIAASVVLLVGLFFVYQNQNSLENDSSTSNIETLPEGITLQLDNGDIKRLSEDGSLNVADASGNKILRQEGAKLIYNDEVNVKDIVYNTLSVPYGKRFEVRLSDGTQVHLNSGTTLRYPVKFLKGNKRKVYLNGEAYFDVSKDKQHPFVVNANDIDLEVLGTQFNMSYYKEDTAINTVLVEGAVRLYEKNNDSIGASHLLRPGYKASWNNAEKQMAIGKVDTELYTAWKDGVLLFRSATFKSIRKKLERHFNITIENHNEVLDNQVYSASFRKESVEEILEAFKEDIPFEYVKVENDKIIITNISN